MDRLKAREAEDVMDRVCIAPWAVARWMKLLEAEGGSPEAVDAMPEERATVETDGGLRVSIELAGLSIEMLCSPCEWAWADGGLQ